jgi:cbb3-type cytochrome oxidase subunit 1
MLSIRLIYAAIAFFVIGVGFGMYMGIAHDFRFTHVHVHLNLLGWVALALIGLLYAMFPDLQMGWRPQAHFWLHVPGLVIFMGGFWWASVSGGALPLAVAVGATMVALGVLVFAVHMVAALPALLRTARHAPAGFATRAATAASKAPRAPS